MTPIVCAGLSHKTAPIALREAVAIPRTRYPEALDRLAREPGVTEAVLVSTCNRTEAYLAGLPAARAKSAVSRFLRQQSGTALPALSRALYVHSGGLAIRHLIEVAAGLDSQVVGEAQIMAQMREAFDAARSAGATAGLLNGTFNRALAAAKRVRTETDIGRLPTSVASIAVQVADRIFGGLTGRSVLLIGTGETGELLAATLKEQGAPDLIVAGVRSEDRARALAGRVGGRALPLNAARDGMAEVDIVVVASSAPSYVVSRAHVAEALRRRSQPIFLIDLSVPRNVDPAVAELSDAYVYNVDDLKGVAEENRHRREQWIVPAGKIVEEAVARTAAWMDSLGAVPTIVSLKAYGESCRREVWARAGRAVRDLPPETLDQVDYLTRALVAKLLHRPMSSLKESAKGNGAVTNTELIRSLFKLD